MKMILRASKHIKEVLVEDLLIWKVDMQWDTSLIQLPYLLRLRLAEKLRNTDQIEFQYLLG